MKLKNLGKFIKISLVLTLIGLISGTNLIFGNNLSLRVPLAEDVQVRLKALMIDEDASDSLVYRGEDAKKFLEDRNEFLHDTLVCNLSSENIDIKMDNDIISLDDVGAIYIKGGTHLDFINVQGPVLVVVITKPDAITEWYQAYNKENFPRSFDENGLGYNDTGVISPQSWIDKGVTIVKHSERENPWTGEPELEWLIDSMVKGEPLMGASVVRYAEKTDAWLDFTAVRGEEYHYHPNTPEDPNNPGQSIDGNFVEVYYVHEGMASIVFEENGEFYTMIMKPGDIFVARDEMRHAIVAMKGPYMHVVVQIPSTFQYGFLFKETVFPASDFVQSDGIKIPLEEVLRRNKPGIYKLDDIDGDILETLRARVTGAERNISHSL